MWHVAERGLPRTNHRSLKWTPHVFNALASMWEKVIGTPRVMRSRPNCSISSPGGAIGTRLRSGSSPFIARDVKVADPGVWDALVSLSGADLATTDRAYLHGEADFCTWLETLRSTHPIG